MREIRNCQNSIKTVSRALGYIDVLGLVLILVPQARILVFW
jgi:hypothetical protein